MKFFSKYDLQFPRRRFFNIFFYVIIVPVTPIHQSHVSGQIKISRTIFEKGHQRNNPVKLFQNMTCVSREDFYRIA